ncbi:Protein rolling stone [Pseudolycoriella hygida]|uniref:Protein rolling stone n=1 Tax=Pseudolycoriella hygida TaxID=35572 RepID=A0A9Q0RWX2_9DIPT|nr:Protein rolling stone [Pseudolycoriella hygida]
MTNSAKRFDITFHGVSPTNFVVSEWQHVSGRCLKYVIYEWTLAAYFIFAFSLSIYTSGKEHQWKYYVIYLTNWNVTLNVISSLMGAILKTLHYNRTLLVENKQREVTRTLNAYWLLSNLSAVMSISISTTYWTLDDSGHYELNDILAHTGNSIIFLFDTFIHARPSRQGHLIYPLAFGFIYLFWFCLPYSLLGMLNINDEPYIYPSLDWKNHTGFAILNAFLFLGLIVLVHSVINFLISARIYIHKKYKLRKSYKSNRDGIDLNEMNTEMLLQSEDHHQSTDSLFS